MREWIEQARGVHVLYALSVDLMDQVTGNYLLVARYELCLGGLTGEIHMQS